MFFVLSKTLGLLALPTNLHDRARPARRRSDADAGSQLLGRRLLVSAMLLLAVVGFTPLGSLMLYPLESRFPKWDPAQGRARRHHRAGRPVDSDLSVMYGMPVTVAGADRVIQAAALARRYPNARILFTGGSANLISRRKPRRPMSGRKFCSVSGSPRSG